MVYKRIGEILIANESITPEQLTRALEIQKKTSGKKIGEILVEQGFTTQRKVYKALERQLGVEFIDLTGLVISKEMARLVPRSIARKYNVVPVQSSQESISLAMAGNVNIVLAVSLIGATTFTLSAIGVKVGNVFGSRFEKNAQIAGGVILILLGLKILLEHLGVIA